MENQTRIGKTTKGTAKKIPFKTAVRLFLAFERLENRQAFEKGGNNSKGRKIF